MTARRWLLPVGWAALIFALTSVPGSAVPDVGGESTDKLIHIILYCVLGAFILRAVWDPLRPMRSLVIAALAASAFGAIDEMHQNLVPGRSADLMDWVADTIGGVTGALAATAMRRRAERTA